MTIFGVLGLGAGELLIILAVLSMVLMIGVVGIVMAALVLRATRSRSRSPQTAPPPG